MTEKEASPLKKLRDEIGRETVEYFHSAELAADPRRAKKHVKIRLETLKATGEVRIYTYLVLVQLETVERIIQSVKHEYGIDAAEQARQRTGVIHVLTTLSGEAKKFSALEPMTSEIKRIQKRLSEPIVAQ